MNEDDFRKELDKRLADEGGMSAWGAYLVARRNGDPIPDFVLQYFDQVADQFLGFTRDPPEVWQQAVARTLGFEIGQRKNPFGKMQREMRDKKILEWWFEYKDQLKLVKDFDSMISDVFDLDLDYATKLRLRLLREMNPLNRWMRERDI